MTDYRVVFRREALRQLEDLYDYIADAGSPENAASFTDAIITYCEGLAAFPRRGVVRDDIRPGLRTIGYRKRVVIAFAILDDIVAVLGAGLNLVSAFTGSATESISDADLTRIEENACPTCDRARACSWRTR